ncbi:hypothetical protein F5Y03DRAFT_204845 [Xylaria venustula]|nr:hypothetical protein F5Y03DRAFT_204845 [Xylaria venustula]
MDFTNAQIFDPWLVCYLLPIPSQPPNATVQIISRLPGPTQPSGDFSFLSSGPPVSEEIEIDYDGDRKPIPANLARFLRVLAPTQGSRAIYADTLTWLRPDAPKLVTRSRVTRAYAMRANCTLCWLGCWLGPELLQTAEAVELLCKAAGEWEPLAPREYNWNRLKHRRLDGIELNDRYICYVINIVSKSPYWSQIDCVLDNVRSQTTTLYLGSHHLNLDQYVRGVQTLQLLPDVENRPPLTDRFLLIQAINNVNRICQHRQPTLVRLLRIAMRFPSADPREVVFDIFPLVAHIERQLQLVVHNTTNELFTLAATVIIQESGIAGLWNDWPPHCARFREGLPS